MDVLLAVTRALLLSLEREDNEMTDLLARSFLTIDALYFPTE
jgi:hypothetical protein